MTAAPFVLMMCLAGIGVALARAVPPGPGRGRRGITSGAETGGGGWMRFRPALGRRGPTGLQLRAEDVPATVSHALAPEPGQAKGP